MIRTLKQSTPAEESYECNVRRLEESARATREGYNAPLRKASRPIERTHGGFTSKPRSEEPPAADPAEPESELAVCDLSEIELARVHARAAKVVSIDQGGIVVLEDETTTERIKAYCHDVAHEGETVFYVVIEQNQFTQKFRILGKRGDTDD